MEIATLKQVEEAFTSIYENVSLGKLRGQANDILHFALEENLSINSILGVFGQAANALSLQEYRGVKHGRTKATVTGKQKGLAKLLLFGGTGVIGMEKYFQQHPDILHKLLAESGSDQDDLGYDQSLLAKCFAQSILLNQRLILTDQNAHNIFSFIEKLNNPLDPQSPSDNPEVVLQGMKDGGVGKLTKVFSGEGRKIAEILHLDIQQVYKILSFNVGQSAESFGLPGYDEVILLTPVDKSGDQAYLVINLKSAKSQFTSDIFLAVVSHEGVQQSFVNNKLLKTNFETFAITTAYAYQQYIEQLLELQSSSQQETNISPHRRNVSTQQASDVLGGDDF